MSARPERSEITHPEIDKNLPAGTPCYYVWLPQWVPIAQDGGGGDLFIDLRPGPASGCVGWFDHEEWAFEQPLWPSLRAMLEQTATALTTGHPVNGDVPIAVDGRLEWRPADDL